MNTISQVFQCTNKDIENALTFVVEPWAEEFNIQSGSKIKIVFHSDYVGRIDTDFGQKVVCIFAWNDCKVQVFVDDVDITPASLSIPIPSH